MLSTIFSVLLCWPAQADATSFKIYVNGVYSAEVPGNAVNLQNLDATILNTFVITALKDGEESLPSDPISIQMPKLEATAPGTVRYWRPKFKGNQIFHIEKSADLNTWSEIPAGELLETVVDQNSHAELIEVKHNIEDVKGFYRLNLEYKAEGCVCDYRIANPPTLSESAPKKH